MIFDKKAIWMFRGIDPAYAEQSMPLMTDMGYQLKEVSIEELKVAYPQIYFGDITTAFVEHDAAYLLASASCQQVFQHFGKKGGKYVEGKVMELISSEDRITGVKLEDGQKLEADFFVLACGPWLKQLVPEMAPIIKVSRQEVYYFDTPEEYNQLPIWVEFREGEEMFYGIPDHFNQGFKFAYDERTWSLDPDKDERGITPEILAKMEGVLKNRFPLLKDAGVIKHHTCVYENSPDGDFIIDKVPGASNAMMMAGSSGHGFKMGPALGELITEYLLKDRVIPKEFSLGRFQNPYSTKTQYQVQ